MENLPNDIIIALLGRSTPCVEDLASVAAVCKSWKSFAPEIRRKQFAPCLMLATCDGDESLIHKFFSLTNKKPFNLELPEAKGRNCWGSACGWVLTIGIDLNIHLLNPISRIRLSLPPQSTFQHQCHPQFTPQHLRKMFVRKFIVSSQTSLVIAIYSGVRRLAFATPGDEVWTCIETPSTCYEDGVFYQGKFYVVDCEGLVVVWDTNIAHPKAIDFASPPESADETNKFYLVEMSGDLLFVERVIIHADEDAPDEESYNKTDFFEVHKYDFDQGIWFEVLDLGDHALFLGNNTSFAISTMEYPDFKRNSIYYSDDHSENYHWGFDNGLHDMGVYDFEERTLEPIYSGSDIVSQLSRPLFVMPSL